MDFFYMIGTSVMKEIYCIFKGFMLCIVFCKYLMQYPKYDNDTLHFLKFLHQYALMPIVFLLTGRFFKILVNYFYAFGEGKKIKNNLNHPHCVKSVQIRSFFWTVFSCIRT